jgi:hypothetical protein
MSLAWRSLGILPAGSRARRGPKLDLRLPLQSPSRLDLGLARKPAPGPPRRCRRWQGGQAKVLRVGPCARPMMVMVPPGAWERWRRAPAAAAQGKAGTGVASKHEAQP